MRSFTAFRTTVGILVALALALPQARADDYAAEMANVVAAPPVREAMRLIDTLDQQTIDWMIELTELPAPPFKEADRAKFFSYLLEETGFDNEIDQAGNVLARIPGDGNGRTLAIVAHLDTVFPEGTDVKVRHHDSEYCAPGISDNGRGLVAMLALARVIKEASIGLRNDILLVASVGEEGIGDLRGVRYLFRDGGPRIDEFIAIDGAGSSRVTVRSVGSIRYKLHIKGPGGHSFGAFGTANPAHALARAIYYFDQDAAEFVVTPGEKATYNVGRIGGGTSVNSIPFENWAEVDMRSADPQRLARLDEILKASVDRAIVEQNARRTEGAPLVSEPERIGFRPAGMTPMDTALVQRVTLAMKANGIDPDFRDGSTDANIPMSQGVPAVTVGGGGQSSGAHSLRECWVDDNSRVALKNIVLMTIASAGLVSAP
ncbi:MAG: M20/M25/M40 family metallo-hydrolase [Pseudomonadales bacterium]|nr:M20/M25/M40 family metallo-hydrolase [Pseudomonadales bacterium]